MFSAMAAAAQEREPGSRNPFSPQSPTLASLNSRLSGVENRPGVGGIGGGSHSYVARINMLCSATELVDRVSGEGEVWICPRVT